MEVPMRTLESLVVILLAVVLLSAPAFAAESKLDNTAVIKLVAAGLAEENILRMIDTEVGSFDVSVTGLLELQKSGVNSKIISAMQQRATSKKGTFVNIAEASPVGTSMKTTIPVPSRDGVYLYSRRTGQLTAVKNEQWNQKRSGFGSALIGKGSASVVVKGSRSPTRIEVGDLLVIKTGGNPNDFTLSPMMVDEEKRSFILGKASLFTGSSSGPDQIPVDFKEEGPNLYSVPITNYGEYGVYNLNGSDKRLFTFSVGSSEISRN